MKFFGFLCACAAGLALLAGCRGLPTADERQARQELAAVASVGEPSSSAAVLPALTPDSSLSNFLAYALLNSPAVKAAFQDWSASVENITIARSMPDPQLTFQSYIQDTLTSLMPGFMQQIPGPGKRMARARVAAAESAAKRAALQGVILQTAFELKRAYYNLGLLGERLRIEHATQSWLENQERVLRFQNEAGLASLPEWLRAQSDLGRVRADLANLEDSRPVAMENFKAALGLGPTQANPPAPARFEPSRDNPDGPELLRFALAHNPQLAALAAEVRAADGGIAEAYLERAPDFNAGLSIEVYRPPFYWPQAGMTLPVWRDKLAAEIAQAQAKALAAQSRLRAAQIDLAVSFAEKSFAYREAGRNLALIQGELLPEARQSLEIIRAGYRTGKSDFLSLAAAERNLLDLQYEAAGDRAAREIALADLSLMVAGVPPANAPRSSNNSQP